MEQAEKPWVTIILTTYNQAPYIKDCIQSVISQQYGNIQLIVIDNASSDGTPATIQDIISSSAMDVILIKNIFNKGLCAAFNQGLAQATGKYVIDLSGDDILLPSRIIDQVKSFENLPEEYAVVFSNARYMNEKGRELHSHYPVGSDGHSLVDVPTNDVYKNVLSRYFICTPTMMIRRSVLVELGGYDESLIFEDFDFWVRSSVKFKYHYLDKILTLKRDVPGSLSSLVYKPGSGMLASYYAICNKAFDLNRDQEEFNLLAVRIQTFIRKCFYAQEFELALKFRKLLNYIENPGWKTEFVVFLCRIHLPVNKIYRFYIKHLQKRTSRRKDLACEIVN